MSFYCNHRPLALLLLAAWAGNPWAGEIRFNFEEPIDGVAYSGVSNLRGWALSTAGIHHIELWVDGEYLSNLPMGGYRHDVETAFPNYPDALNSGFSMAFNYSNLADGNHTFTVRVVDRDGTALERSAITPIIGFHTGFVRSSDTVDLADARIVGRGNRLEIEGMRVEGIAYDVTTEWRAPDQGMRFDAIAESQDQGGDTCVEVPWIAAGTVATLDYTKNAGGTASSGTTELTHLAMGPDGSHIHSHNSFAVPANGVSGVEEYEYTVASHVVDDMLYVSRKITDGILYVMGMSSPVYADITMEPDLLAGPAGHFCTDQSWVSEPVTQTIIGYGGAAPWQNQTPRAAGEVLSLNRPITVPGGTFNTVNTRVDRSDGTSTVAWIDIGTGVTVQQEDYVDGALFYFAQLTSLQ